MYSNAKKVAFACLLRLQLILQRLVLRVYATEAIVAFLIDLADFFLFADLVLLLSRQLQGFL